MLHIETQLHLDCEGYRGLGSLVLRYSFPDGVQGPQHPSPGLRYTGTNRTAYLPNTAEGAQALALLKKAFTMGKMFRIGQSVTTGRTNTVVYGGLHIKTNVSGGASKHGYPDEDFLMRLISECAVQGIFPVLEVAR